MYQQLRIGHLLRSHGMRRNPLRMEIQAWLMANEAVLSASDHRARIAARHDRGTIHRALSAFEEHGLLHRASEDGQGIKYALCGGHCPDQPQADGHAHLICDACHQTYCLEKVAVLVVELSDHFTVTRRMLSLNGICRACNA